MYKFLNTVGQVLILLHVTEANIAPHVDFDQSKTCLKYTMGHVCKTSVCQDEANFILKRMNVSEDPCQNFYKFACDRYVKGKADSYPNLHLIASEEVKKDISRLLNEPRRKEDDPKLLLLIKNAKKGCLHAGKRIKNYLEIFNEYGGFPLLEKNWNESSFTWQKYFNVSRKYGHQANDLFSINIRTDPDDYKRRIIYIAKPKEYHPQFLTHTFEHRTVVSLAHTLGLKIVYEILEQLFYDGNRTNPDVEQMYELGALKILQANIPLKTNVKQPISKLYELCPSIPWLDIINILVAPNKFNDTQMVLIACPECLENLEKILTDIPKKIIVNYVLFQFMAEHIFELNNVLREAIMYHYKLSLNKVCEDLVVNYFYLALDNSYVTRYLNRNVLQKVETVAQNILEEAKRSIPNIKIFKKPMDRQHIFAKLNKLKLKIGVHDHKVLDKTHLEIYYGNINFSIPGMFIWEMRAHHLSEYYASVTEIKQYTSYMRATSVRALCHLYWNHIEIPAALIKVFWKNQTPNYLAYGRIGRTIGHEITHLNSAGGLVRDQYGDYDSNFYSTDTLNRAAKSMQCLADQFDKYSIPNTNITVSGTTLMSEAQADNGAFYLAYNAYIHKEKLSEEYLLPGFERFSPQQMFWISYATGACDKLNAEKIAIFTQDNHPVNHLRVYGGLKNSKYFSRDFECKPRTEMNPEHKCTYWEADGLNYD